MIRPILMLLAALTFAADATGQDLAREIAALRPKDVSAREEAVLDNLEQRANRALAAIPRARDRREAGRPVLAQAALSADPFARDHAPALAARRRWAATL